MDRRQKKGINFALDTEALKEHDTKEGWHNAYYDVRPFSRIMSLSISISVILGPITIISTLQKGGRDPRKVLAIGNMRTTISTIEIMVSIII